MNIFQRKKRPVFGNAGSLDAWLGARLSTLEGVSSLLEALDSEIATETVELARRAPKMTEFERAYQLGYIAAFSGWADAASEMLDEKKRAEAHGKEGIYER